VAPASTSPGSITPESRFSRRLSRKSVERPFTPCGGRRAGDSPLYRAVIPLKANSAGPCSQPTRRAPPSASGDQRQVPSRSGSQQPTNRELLDAWTGSLEELHRRGVVRTYNNPIGDIAEALVARHYGGTRAAFDNPACDVAVGDTLLQVKACRRSSPTTKLGFSPLRHREGYTAVVLVVFSADMRVEQAWSVPREVANELASGVPHVNGWRIGLALSANLT
jgi:hypothetical protein